MEDGTVSKPVDPSGRGKGGLEGRCHRGRSGRHDEDRKVPCHFLETVPVWLRWIAVGCGKGQAADPKIQSAVIELQTNPSLTPSVSSTTLPHAKL